MSDKDFIILPNGHKLFLKDMYGSVEETKVSQKSRMFNLFIAFNKDFEPELNSNEVKSIFDSLKEFASKDGNNELSTAELMGFVKEHIKDDYAAEMITQKEVMRCLEIIQKESDKSLKDNVPPHIENTISNFFPELNFLDLGMDNSVDTSKLSFDEIKKHFPEDKYTLEETTRTEYYSFGGDMSRTVSDYEFPGSTPRERKTITIKNKETGDIVVTYKDNDYNLEGFSITLKDEHTGRTLDISSGDNQNYHITSMEDNWNNRSLIDISGSHIYYARRGEENYNFSDGILNSISTPDKNIRFKNGVKVSEEKKEKSEDAQELAQAPEVEEYVIHTNIAIQLNELINNNDINKITELLTKSVQTKNIGLDMDEYFAQTGRELIDDIQNSDIPIKDKKQILEMINKPYVESKYYDPHKKVESSRIENKYYTSPDEYSIQFNGPIINIENKTTGKKTRINLHTLLKDMDYREKERMMHKSLQTLQSYSGEILENLGIEIEKIYTLSREEAAAAFNGHGGMVGGYRDNMINMVSLHRGRGTVLVHEIGHGIDNTEGGMISTNSKFKEVYDKCIKRYTENGHRRFDDFHPMRSMPFLPINKGTKYATYNENEAFAICMQILMGYEDSDTKFVRNYMPELIDAAKELYLEIKNKPIEERQKFNTF